MPEQFELFADPIPDDESPNSDAKPETTLQASPRILYFDLETQRGTQDVGGWSNIHKMGMAVGVVFDSIEERMLTYLENEEQKLLRKLRSADLVVGFNVKRFDYTVMQPYDPDFDLNEINTCDMLEHVEKKLGFRLGLNHLAQHTLGARKSADGLVSLEWYREYKNTGDPAFMDRIVEYCKKDVEITRDLYLFGVQNGFIRYLSKGGIPQTMEVDWKPETLIPVRK
ncbi:MAG: DEAD/DEAH box helicase [Nitrospinae bacterium CG11_big_fil_rev_8_21_14_0_20_56_8]|nr:MAG: DEAD/DEAH box helicase [Nitrospinae bacterium CG11_big_fil_rev_8_21_14_0_20_56_8]